MGVAQVAVVQPGDVRDGLLVSITHRFLTVDEGDTVMSSTVSDRSIEAQLSVLLCRKIPPYTAKTHIKRKAPPRRGIEPRSSA